jgi:hypothetical protein
MSLGCWALLIGRRARRCAPVGPDPLLDVLQAAPVRALWR